MDTDHRVDADINKTEEKAPFFSVILPTYNNEQDLEKCIKSILAQSYREFELIIVDDGSTDATPEICNRFAKEDHRVSVIHKAHGGVVAARNIGLFKAKGSYIYYVDGDDWIAKELLEEAARILDVPNPPDIFVFGHFVIWGDGQRESRVWQGRPGLYEKEQLEKEVYPRMYYTETYQKMWGVSGSLCDKVIAKELLIRHYCRNMNLFVFEDLVCAYECMFFAKQVYFSNRDMYFYNRISQNSMHKRYHADLFENTRMAAGYLRASLAGRGKSIDLQINRIEFDGLVSCLYQEIQFGASLEKSADFLKSKMKQIKQFPICPIAGLKWYEQCYILMLSFRLFYLPLLLGKLWTALVHRKKRKQKD